jgi:hypothetical protein
VLDIPTQNTFVEINIGWTVEQDSGITLNPTVGSQTVVTPGIYFTDATIAYSSLAGSNTLEFTVFKNGAPLQTHTAFGRTGVAVQSASVALGGIDSAAANDVYDLRVKCTTEDGMEIMVQNVNFSIFRIA